ncbi:unnamed protein product [Leptosia nina]|uniref:Uncharacterized protein n=1 Tax=Leptosia nina TaxID=320188 RepID=A0AAV1J286_9NEOP
MSPVLKQTQRPPFVNIQEIPLSRGIAKIAPLSAETQWRTQASIINSGRGLIIDALSGKVESLWCKSGHGAAQMKCVKGWPELHKLALNHATSTPRALLTPDYGDFHPCGDARLFLWPDYTGVGDRFSKKTWQGVLSFMANYII